MILEHHIETFREMILSGRYATKKDAAIDLMEEAPEILEGYKDERSCRIRLNQLLAEHYPDMQVKKGPRKEPELRHSMPDPDAEIVEENVRLAQQRQGLMDRNRIQNKAFREQARIHNALEAYTEALVDTWQEWGWALGEYEKKEGVLTADAAVGVLHLSDIHLNELIDLPSNQYDFEVAAKRLQKLAAFTKLQGRAFGIEKLVVCFGGDLMNSDRRLDELLHMATNRARATDLGIYLFMQFLLDLRSEFFVDVFGVTGNEGRAKQELGWGDVAVTDNYDAMIYYGLQSIFKAVQEVRPDRGLRFHPLVGNERTFTIHQETFMLVHGHQVNCADQKKVQAIIGKKAAQGQFISHILAGHIHASLVSDYVSRNSSMAGSNAYSEEALQFVSKAAQNLHIVTTDSLYGIKVDLQNTGDLEGYDIIEDLKAHNAKSVGKAYMAGRSHHPVVVVI